VHHETSLPSTSEASGLARSELDGLLVQAVDPATAESVRLATSELVANAVRHAANGAAEPISLRIDLEEATLRIEVEQSSPALGARVIPAPERGAGGGYGLAIVAALADRWGVDPGPPGNVWFEVRHEPVEGPPASQRPPLRLRSSAP
jgi:anti-sigma regulatory factor (Ser/Thr protein kinase)